ncbi:LysR family transcriptional regulator [Marinitenerispora sediminis]|uniref:LysR family transcriptional regulator n=1 Tax=Marinitenerispora sediminis TaxID=1931232 RepID=A0A368T8D7_9ACTN|nr:LysR family transcriptional regulator [Marinitenerispora sediminis]RCV57758.1 LysR family transcriptional regulator [Marinitenerispora sediminis]RCV57889.1 LysR family transcriptional regulator [Marinitenerispora sediminis]RCV60642.1 LysR family transcriptional regulator [Marinitenerispora sediminis]
MDTRLLRTFVTLARTGGFTSAAAELHLAQSTVTVQIRTLERELRARLFDRVPSGAVLTETGRRLLDHADRVLAAEARLRAEAAADSAETGLVTVGATESLCAYRLPGAVMALRRTHPGIEIRLVASGKSEALDRITAGQLDLALLLDADVAAPRVHAEPIGHERPVLVAAPGHPLVGREATWPELAAESFVLLEEGCGYCDDLADRLRRIPDARPRLTRFGSIESVRACVAAGLGLGLLPEVSIAPDIAAGRLGVIPQPRLPDVPVQLVRHRDRWTAPAARTVMDTIRTLAAAGWPTERSR